ncbi:MAG: TIGR01777 family protein [Chlorobi bacterium]|nr:TIGR01777 family protein [Chlorobiota bacterium]
MKNILIFGGSGFIGRHLINEIKDDYQITVLSRNPVKAAKNMPGTVKIKKLDPENPEKLVLFFDEADGIVNLAGENVGSRWTKKKMDAIRQSRLEIDQLIVDAFQKARQKPSFIIQGSGMGVYGFKPTDDTFTEDSPLGKEGFLTETGIAHEKAFDPLKGSIRLVFLRTGLVLDRKGGALPMTAASFKIFLGGPVGNGKQWISWIHIRDEVRAIRFLMEKETASGAYNLTAPNPVRQKEFAVALAKALHRPAAITTPAAFLKTMMGPMADELLLSGLKIIPKRLTDAGFKFKFNTIEEAFADIYH